MDDKTLVERLHIIRDRYCLMNDEYDNMTEAADTIEAQATRIEALEAALCECIDVMGPLAKYPNVNLWLIQAKQALEGSGNG